MKHFNVDLVVHGSTANIPDSDGLDPYRVPKEQGKFKNILTGNTMNTDNIIERIIENRLVLFFDFRNRIYSCIKKLLNRVSSKEKYS